MTKTMLIAALCGMLSLCAVAHADGRVAIRPDAAERFATLPAGAKFPEGIAANPANGDIYVGTFNFGPEGNFVLRFNRRGKLIGSLAIPQPLLGLAFNRIDRKVYIANFGASKIQRVNADLSGLADIASIPGIGAPDPLSVGNPDGSSDTITFGSNSFPAPNAMTFNAAGDLYVSDSFQGVIWVVLNAASCAPCGPATEVVQDGRLATAGFPPFGANGLALSKDEKTLFVANTGDDRILKVDLTNLPSGISTFADSINGADGIVFDKRGALWVAANQQDEIVGLDTDGRTIARLGAFRGTGRDGAVRGLLFPASPVIVGSKLYVTNLALPLTGLPSEPEADVTTYTVSVIDLDDNGHDRDRHDD